MYLPLFDIEVRHQFFTSGMHRTFTVSPTAGAEALADQLGLSSRQTPDGVRVFYESRRLQDLQAAHAGEALSLGFKLETPDHMFGRYTEPACPEGGLFYFDQREAQEESAERSRLHREGHVSEAEVEWLDAPRVDELLAAEERAPAPLGLIRISPTPSEVLQTYYIRFAARRTFWTYYLLGSFARDGLYMDDAKGEVEFDALGEVTLPGGQAARGFRTTTRLPLQDRYHNRFQIIDPAAAGDRVLMARMPGASVRQTYAERPYAEGQHREDTAVSEIFINGF